MGKNKTSHSNIKRLWFNLSNRCVECNMKIPKGDVHYSPDGKAYCGRCAYERKVKA